MQKLCLPCERSRSRATKFVPQNVRLATRNARTLPKSSACIHWILTELCRGWSIQPIRSVASSAVSAASSPKIRWKYEACYLCFKYGQFISPDGHNTEGGESTDRGCDLWQTTNPCRDMTEGGPRSAAPRMTCHTRLSGMWHGRHNYTKTIRLVSIDRNGKYSMTLRSFLPHWLPPLTDKLTMLPLHTQLLTWRHNSARKFLLVYFSQVCTHAPLGQSWSYCHWQIQFLERGDRSWPIPYGGIRIWQQLKKGLMEVLLCVEEIIPDAAANNNAPFFLVVFLTTATLGRSTWSFNALCTTTKKHQKLALNEISRVATLVTVDKSTRTRDFMKAYEKLDALHSLFATRRNSFKSFSFDFCSQTDDDDISIEHHTNETWQQSSWFDSCRYGRSDCRIVGSTGSEVMLSLGLWSDIRWCYIIISCPSPFSFGALFLVGWKAILPIWRVRFRFGATFVAFLFFGRNLREGCKRWFRRGDRHRGVCYRLCGRVFHWPGKFVQDLAFTKYSRLPELRAWTGFFFFQNRLILMRGPVGSEAATVPTTSKGRDVEPKLHHRCRVSLSRGRDIWRSSHGIQYAELSVFMPTSVIPVLKTLCQLLGNIYENLMRILATTESKHWILWYLFHTWRTRWEKHDVEEYSESVNIIGAAFCCYANPKLKLIQLNFSKARL